MFVKAFSTLSARERKALKLFSAASECEYRNSRACLICAVRRSVGVGEVVDGSVGGAVGAGLGAGWDGRSATSSS